MCWGDNANGTLGNTTLTPTTSSSPVPVVGVQTGAQLIAGTHVGGNPGYCAIMSDKTLQCWGGAFDWMIGRDPTSANSGCGCYPNAGAPTLSGTNDMISIAVGDAVGVGVHSSSVGVAWGYTGYGVNPSSTPTPVTAIASLPNVATVAVGSIHGCGMTSGGDVWCWGTNVHGELGQGNTTGNATCTSGPCSTVAEKVNGVAATRISVGAGFTVVISDHSALAWGFDTRAQLGHALSLDATCGTAKCAMTPTKVEGLPGTN